MAVSTWTAISDPSSNTWTEITAFVGDFGSGFGFEFGLGEPIGSTWTAIADPSSNTWTAV